MTLIATGHNLLVFSPPSTSLLNVNSSLLFFSHQFLFLICHFDCSPQSISPFSCWLLPLFQPPILHTEDVSLLTSNLLCNNISSYFWNLFESPIGSIHMETAVFLGEYNLKKTERSTSFIANKEKIIST